MRRPANNGRQVYRQAVRARDREVLQVMIMNTVHCRWLAHNSIAFANVGGYDALNDDGEWNKISPTLFCVEQNSGRVNKKVFFNLYFFVNS